MSARGALPSVEVTGSYLKLIGFSAAVLASLVAATSIGWRELPGAAAWFLTGLCALGSLPPLLIMISGAVVLLRHRRAQSGEPDPYLAQLPAVSEETPPNIAAKPPGWLRRKLAHAMLAHDMVVGDEVEVLSLDQIAATLGPDGKLDGIEFMAEMRAYCGQRARVFRCLDKIYDYGRTKQMRSLDGFVLLGGLRCDGSAHGGCEAGCYLIWHTRWLRRVSPSRSPVALARPSSAPRRPEQSAPEPTDAGRQCYSCQFTQLHAASRPTSRRDPRPDLRALVAGNVTMRGFAMAVSTRLFNMAQGMRGGVGFPYMPAPAQKSSDEPVSRLLPGMEVRVLSVAQIARTLGPNYRHRGLWFDADMVKFCGSLQRVERRVERLIDDATGEMRIMKTPCIVLKDVDSTGEFLRFNPQHDPLFWREAWLKPASDD